MNDRWKRVARAWSHLRSRAATPTRRHSVGFHAGGRDPEQARPVHLSGGTPDWAVPSSCPSPSGARHRVPNTPEPRRAQRKRPLHQPTPPSADNGRPALGAPTTARSGSAGPPSWAADLGMPEPDFPTGTQRTSVTPERSRGTAQGTGGRAPVASAPWEREPSPSAAASWDGESSPSASWHHGPSPSADRVPLSQTPTGQSRTQPSPMRRPARPPSAGRPGPPLQNGSASPPGHSGPPAARNPADLPPVHSAIICVALPGLAISTDQGQLTGQGLEGFYRTGRRVLSRCQVRVAGREPLAVQAWATAADRARFVATLRVSPGGGPDPDVVVERTRHADGTECITLHSAVSRPLRLPVEVTLGTDLADLGAIASGRAGPDLPASVYDSGLRWSCAAAWGVGHGRSTTGRRAGVGGPPALGVRPAPRWHGRLGAARPHGLVGLRPGSGARGDQPPGSRARDRRPSRGRASPAHKHRRPPVLTAARPGTPHRHSHRGRSPLALRPGPGRRPRRSPDGTGARNPARRRDTPHPRAHPTPGADSTVRDDPWPTPRCGGTPARPGARVPRPPCSSPYSSRRPIGGGSRGRRRKGCSRRPSVVWDG